MIDTTEAGAGSYPEPIENDEYKCYRFVTEITAKLNGFVYAHNEDEAKEFIEQGQNDDLNDIYDIKIEEITEIKKVDD